MSIFGLNTGIDPDGYISSLPGDVFQKLRDQLDTNPADKDWRALVRVAEHNYHIKPAMIERWSPAISNESPAGKLLTELSSRGMTIRELQTYLNKLEIDTYPLGLSKYEDIRIIEQPDRVLEIYEGDPLVLQVEATGKPFPRYQWFFCQNGKTDFVKLLGRTEKKLMLNNTTTEHAGSYSCQIYNCADPKKTRLTDITLVSVAANPCPISNGLCPPKDEDVIHIYSLQNPASSPDVMRGLVSSHDRLACGMVDYSLIIGHPRDVEVGMNEPFVLSVETCGNPPITYQWYRNGLKLNGKVAPKLSVAHTSAADFGKYHCVVNDGLRLEQSNYATVKQKFPVPVNNIDIMIVSQPKSATVKFGGCALFSCEAKCCRPLNFQWFKDGKAITGETSSELKFRNIQDRCSEGFYMCEISVDEPNGPRVHTAGAILKVEVPSVNDNIEYNPSDKVVLLIGNSDYKCEARLNASTKDVTDLREAFNSLDFKVVSLLNLTKPEIENAVLSFCELVDKNVYAVFYFCGHGFEEQGLSYLVPTDAPHGYSAQHCVCAQQVLENIQKKNPALVFMIMDICRQAGKVKSSGVAQNMNMSAKGNTVFCYATSVGLAAYENRHGGLLVNHLSPLLIKPIGIDNLVSQLKEEFNRVRKHSEIQIPELRSNLLEPRRSLADKISLKGQTEAFQLRTAFFWNNTHAKPAKQIIDFSPVGVKIELDFQADFSNILSVFVSVLNPGCTEGCVGKITNFSPSVSQLDEIVEFKRDSRMVTKITLQDIQKLKENLIVDVTITFYVKGGHYFLMKRIDLGQPLVAKLRLWEQRDTREPIEQAEDTSLN